jgi:hypothetical protein
MDNKKRFSKKGFSKKGFPKKGFSKKGFPKEIMTRLWINTNMLKNILYSPNSKSPLEKITNVVNGFVVFLAEFNQEHQQKPIGGKPFKELEFKNYDYQVVKGIPGFFTVYFFTKQNNNHPFLGFGNVSDKQYTFMYPFGDKPGYININKVSETIPLLSNNEKIALTFLLWRTLEHRKQTLITNQKFSTLSSSNGIYSN